MSIDGDRFFRYACHPEDRLGRILHWRGIAEWEAETLSLFIPLAGASRFFIDIGAYTGVYTLLACASNKHIRVLAIEPMPDTRELLQTNVALNRMQDRCEILAVALGAKTGKARFLIPPRERFPSMAHVIADDAEVGLNHRTVNVEVRTLDELCSGRGEIDLIKLDVEGGELLALQGMRQILAEHCPAIIMEVLPDAPLSELEIYLRTFNYSFFVISNRGLIPMKELKAQPKAVGRNYLCVDTARYRKLSLSQYEAQKGRRA